MTPGGDQDLPGDAGWGGSVGGVRRRGEGRNYPQRGNVLVGPGADGEEFELSLIVKLARVGQGRGPLSVKPELNRVRQLPISEKLLREYS